MVMEREILLKGIGWKRSLMFWSEEIDRGGLGRWGSRGGW